MKNKSDAEMQLLSNLEFQSVDESDPDAPFTAALKVLTLQESLRRYLPADRPDSIDPAESGWRLRAAFDAIGMHLNFLLRKLDTGLETCLANARECEPVTVNGQPYSSYVAAIAVKGLDDFYCALRITDFDEYCKQSGNRSQCRPRLPTLDASRFGLECRAIMEEIQSLPEVDFCELTFALRKEMFNYRQAVNRRGEKHTPEGTVFVFTPLQSQIWNALEGKALKKQPLADEICGSDGGRLYKTGGIKELIDAGKVQHKHGVGYYRPDAPPMS
ncbi:MAG: hypothetical protein IT427_10870 [Pirellulales bacterium]|nr:hypothetical protein [Pirellulales bacterium]